MNLERPLSAGADYQPNSPIRRERRQPEHLPDARSLGIIGHDYRIDRNRAERR
jgi:hypothetical protein